VEILTDCFVTDLHFSSTDFHIRKDNRTKSKEQRKKEKKKKEKRQGTVCQLSAKIKL